MLPLLHSLRFMGIGGLVDLRLVLSPACTCVEATCGNKRVPLPAPRNLQVSLVHNRLPYTELSVWYGATFPNRILTLKAIRA